MMGRRSGTQGGQVVRMKVPVGVFGVLLAAAGVPEGAAADGAGMPGVQAASTLQGAQGATSDQALSFDSDFLSMGGGGQGKHVDLSYFAHKGGMQPGRYAVQVKVNGKMVDDGRLVSFRSFPDQPGKLYACVSAEQAAQWWGIIASRRAADGPSGSGDKDKKVGSVGEPAGAAAVGPDKDTPPSAATSSQAVDGTAPVTMGTAGPDPVDKGAAVKSDAAGDTPGATSAASGEATCPVGGVTAMVPYAKEEFDFNKHLLSLTVPQASLGPASRLRTPPQMWNEGMPAILMNYNYSGSQQNSRGKKSGSDFLGLNGQMNVLGWRVRNDMTWHKSQGQSAQWNASQVYAQHDFAAMGGGQVTVGHTTSSGGGVDSVQFTGVKLDSDEAMLDPKFTTYSPAITGVANSPATVTVRQYGKVIYQQNVPQGPFSLTDFNRSGNGSVDVEIREADGQTRHFTMAQAQNGGLLRQGGLTWSASAGKASNGTGYADDKFVQSGVSYGAWANTTLNGGALLSKDYQAVAVGTSVYAGAWGAVSYTLNTARANLSVVPGEQGSPTGVSHAVSWSRSFGNTSVGVSWTHAQTRDYHSYAELLAMKPRAPDETRAQSNGTRDSYSVSLSQSMGVWGSVSLSGSRSTSWGSDSVQNNVSLSYNTTVKDIGIGVSLGLSTTNGSDSRYDDGNSGNTNAYRFSGSENRTDRTIGVNISLPLGKWLNANSVNGTYSYSRSNGSVSQQAGLSGSALNGALSYSASQGISGSKTGNTSVGYSGRYGSMNGGYSYGGGSNSYSYGVSGGLALHPHGVTLGKQLALSGGNALVEVPGVGGLNVGSAVTDWRGYALVSGLTPYDLNRINVDMTNLPGNVELDASSKNVVPTRGALVAVPFKSNKGYRMMLTLSRDKDGVPFGSTVSLVQADDSALPVTGIVGEDGQVYLSGMPAKGQVLATWGDGKDNRCAADFSLPDKADEDRLATLTAVCR
ncbi:fimbria/pilus outer membrane usher protein [Serratia marcescens]|uniref:fimbria/pilus outer membrane usher protein n=1 Tax=Serratia marcescens TaxID=615 RepID=UPI000E0803B3|nr:fimbria/pilus outer membrane usher protein [Serratia marcescens]SUJ36014.1 Outer membrane usher protein fimD precursor [Serratia marcescens]